MKMTQQPIFYIYTGAGMREDADKIKSIKVVKETLEKGYGIECEIYSRVKTTLS
jgi:hypothetical protein